MKLLKASADQAVYHDFIVAPTTCAAAKRLYYAFVVDGELDLDRLRRAIVFTTAQHAALRTSLQVVDGELTQVIREMSEITEEPSTQAAWDGTAESTTRFVCALDDWWSTPRELAIRCVLGHSPDGRTLVVCAFNHACVDGIAVELVIDLIRSEYDAPSREASPEEVEQFSDHYPGLVTEGLDAVYDDWLDALSAAAPAVPQRMLESKLEHRDGWKRYLTWDLPRSVVLQVRELTRTYRCSPFEALAVSVGAYFRRPDGRPVGVGVTHSGRHRPRGLDVVGLLRSHVLDVAELSPDQVVQDAFVARRDMLRRSVTQLGRLPAGEACVRAGVPTGWRAGTLGQWQVELNGMYEKPLSGTLGGCAVEAAPTTIPDEEYGENTGPCFLIAFTVEEERIGVVLRHTDPPVSPDMAKQVAADLEAMVEFIAAHPGQPLTTAPAFFRTGECLINGGSDDQGDASDDGDRRGERAGRAGGSGTDECGVGRAARCDAG